MKVGQVARKNFALRPSDSRPEDIARAMFEPMHSDEEVRKVQSRCVGQELSIKVQKGSATHRWLEASQTE